MRSAKTLAAGLLLAPALLAMTACGSTTTPSGGGRPAADGSIDLRMTVWTSNEDHLALFNSIADEYKAEHPEIGSITFDALEFAAYNTTLTTQIAGGTAPDLAWLGDISNDLIAADALAPLSDTLESAPDWDYDDLVPALTDAYSGPDGELYAYPMSNSPFVLYVNDDLLDEAGVELDTTSLTWQDVADAGAKVNKETGKAGLVIQDFDFANWQNLSTVWAGWGAEPWSEDGATCTFDSPEMVDAFTFLHDSIFEDEAMPGPGVTADFFAGDSAFTVTQISRAALLDGSFERSIIPLPDGPEGDYSVMGQAGIGVLNSGKNVPAATDFLAFLTNPENAAKLAAFFPPPRQSLLTADKLAANNPALTADELQAGVVDQLPDAEPLPGHEHPAEIAANGKAALDAMWTADADVSAVLSSVCDAIEPQLAD
jgi:ABC-type glycerol-3-phosphate transport system substrate-binding protein